MRLVNRFGLFVAGVGVFARPGLSPSLGDVPRFKVIDLGPLPGDNGSYAYGINQQGVVTGYSFNRWWVDETVYETGTPFLYDGGQMISLGAMNGQETWGNAVNANGQVVGTADYGFPRGFLWENGEYVDLGTLGGCCTEAFDINDAGVVVGRSSGGHYHPFKWENGVMTDLATVCSDINATAYAINNAGQIVGTCNGAFFWEDGQMIDLGQGTPRDINDAGVIVGESVIPGVTTEATVWVNGQKSLLGRPVNAFSSHGYAINDLGHVVGLARMAPSASNAAMLWAYGQIYNLNDLIDPASGWQLSTTTLRSGPLTLS